MDSFPIFNESLKFYHNIQEFVSHIDLNIFLQTFYLLYIIIQLAVQYCNLCENVMVKFRF